MPIFGHLLALRPSAPRSSGRAIGFRSRPRSCRSSPSSAATAARATANPAARTGSGSACWGSTPGSTHDSLARDGRGRRVFPAAPAASLMLLKPTARIPHGGGRRFEVGSPEYRTIERWIAQGMPFDPERDPR